MTKEEKTSLRPIIVAVVSFVTITALLTVAVQAVGLERLRAVVEGTGPLAPLAYVAARALTNIVAPLNSGPLGFSAGIMFGLWEGALLSLAGELLGCTVNFWIARKLGRPLVARFVGQSGLGRVESIYRQVGQPLTLAYARLFLFAIYDLVSYAAGLTTIRFRWFFVITLVGGIIPNVLSVAIGTSLTGDFGQLMTMYALLGALCLVAFVAYRRTRRWFRLEERFAVATGDGGDVGDASSGQQALP